MATGIDELETLCRSIFAKAGKTWTWDERFGAVLLTLDVADKQVIGDVTALIGKGWKSTDIGTAPKRIQELAEDAGGLDPGQWLLCSDKSEGPIVYATVWPWGNGKTISLRVSYQAPAVPDAARPAENSKLKGWFGVK